MRLASVVLPAFVLGACASTPATVAPSPADAQAKAAPVEYRSALDGYRPFADQDLQDWRRANEEVGAAGGHKGHGPGQPESSGGAAEHRGHK